MTFHRHLRPHSDGGSTLTFSSLLAPSHGRRYTIKKLAWQDHVRKQKEIRDESAIDQSRLPGVAMRYQSQCFSRCRRPRPDTAIRLDDGPAGRSHEPPVAEGSISANSRRFSCTGVSESDETANPYRALPRASRVENRQSVRVFRLQRAVAAVLREAGACLVCVPRRGKVHSRCVCRLATGTNPGMGVGHGPPPCNTARLQEDRLATRPARRRPEPASRQRRSGQHVRHDAALRDGAG